MSTMVGAKNRSQSQSSSAFAVLSAVWIIARLTMTEAVRRRFYLAGLLVCMFYVVLAFFPIHFSAERRELLGPLLDQFVGALMGTFGSEMIEFFCFLFAVALSAGAISAEVERGTLAVIAPKPLPRWTIYVGKMLGVLLFIAPLMLILTCLLQWAIWMHIHQTLPGVWRGMGAIFLYPLLFTCVTLCFSSFAGNLLATIMPLILASVAWSEGMLRVLGWGLNIDSLKLASRIVIYVVPLNPMSRWLERAQGFTILKLFPIGCEHPWPPDPPANYIDLAWILGYALAFFVIGLIVFEKRDL